MSEQTVGASGRSTSHRHKYDVNAAGKTELTAYDKRYLGMSFALGKLEHLLNLTDEQLGHIATMVSGDVAIQLRLARAFAHRSGGELYELREAEMRDRAVAGE